MGYRPTGLSLNGEGAIRDGYSDTGLRMAQDGRVLDHYGTGTGLSFSNGVISRGY